jgi:hypothetical protein
VGFEETKLDDPPPPRAVGSLHKHESSLIGRLEMPADALDPVLQMLQAGRLKYVALDGEALRYDKTLIRHYEMKQNDVDGSPASVPPVRRRPAAN